MGKKSDNRGETLNSTITAKVRSAVESGGVILLRGGAGCGKTTIALELYERFSRNSLKQPRCCIITPNTQHREYVTSLLLQRSPCGVLVSPQVTTFAGLAGRILSASQDSAKSISPFARYLLLRNIITELNAAGKLPVFAPVSDTLGMVTAVDRAIAELKRAAVDENDLEYALYDTAGKPRDLLRVYTAYQQRLREMELFDVEGQMWCGRDNLKKIPADAPNENVGLGEIDVIVIDGFTDFTPTQLETLTLLVPRVKAMLITLSITDDQRERMWFWTKRTRERILAMPVGRICEIKIPAPAAGVGVIQRSLQNILPRIFDHDARPCEPPDGLCVIAATGIDCEVAAVARKIKRLLAAGANPCSIGVVARSIDTYHKSICRIFGECDIPVAPPAVSLGDVPVVRFYLDVAGVSESNFAISQILHVIKNSYFRPQVLGDFSACDVSVVETIIREANISGGRDAYMNAFERTGGSVAPAAIKSAREMLEVFFNLVQTSAGPSGLLKIIDALQLRTVSWNPADIERSARDIRAVDMLMVAVASLGETTVKIETLREALLKVSLAPARCESLVDVMSVLDARAIRWEHVFLLGCGEGQFPQKVTDLSLLSEKQRQTWNERGINLDRRSDLTAREMLLFYLAVSRADKTLTLSYHQSDSSGGASAAGSFLQSLMETCGGEAAFEASGQITRIKPGQFVQDTSRLASHSEVLNTAIAGLFQQGERIKSPSESALRWIVDNRPELISRVGSGLWASHKRWETGSYNEFDGRISEAGLLESLALQYPGETVFSASRLSMYGQCPWKYFAKYVLQLKPLAEPEKQLEAASLGIFCHDVLWSTLTQLAERYSRPLRLKNIGQAEIFETFDKCFDAESVRVESRGLAYPALWKIQQQPAREHLRDYLERQRCGDLPDFESLHFEFGFGLDVRGEHLDSASVCDPVTISTPGGPVKLRGKIDRIDRVKVQDIEGLFVVDYKTGKIPTGSKSIDKQNLQMPLYTEAVEQIFNLTSLGGVFHSLTGKKDRYFAAFTKSGGKIKLVKQFARQRSDALETVGRFVTSMGCGRFDLPAAKPDDCKYCEYRSICHFSPVRSEIKFPDSQAVAKEAR